MTKDEAVELSGDEEMLFCDGFDDALVGVVTDFGRPPRACYDIDKMIEILVTRDGATYEEAVEYLEFNTFGAYVGPYTPCFIRLTTIEGSDALQAGGNNGQGEAIEPMGNAQTPLH